jgi:hypothetical protein
MQVTLDIPDAYAAQLQAAGKDPARAALEAPAIEGYRDWQLGEYEVRLMLGYESRYQVWDLLGKHHVDRQIDEEYVRQEIAASEELHQTRISQKV